MSKNPCIGSEVVVKFFRNNKIRARLHDKVYYTLKDKTYLCIVIFKEGKYLTLKDTQSEEVFDNIRIIDITPKNANTIITRSLGKIGVINPKIPIDAMPKDCELWLCVIIGEVFPGRSSGCFILDPVRRLSSDVIDRLLPGMYEEAIIDRILYINPTHLYDKDDDRLYWMLPLMHRKGLKDSMGDDFYAIIVKLGMQSID